MIDCRRCQEYLEETALSEVNSMIPEAQQHLERCDECRDVLVQLRDAWALLPLALECESISGEMESQLMERIEGSLQNERSPVLLRQFPLLIKYGLAATILIAVMSSLIVWGRQQVEATRLATDHANTLQRQLDQFGKWEQSFGRPNLRFVSLQDVAAAPLAHGYLVHDLLGEEGHFFAFDLPSSASGQVYKLWIIGKDRRVSASGVLERNDKGIASTSVAISNHSAEIGQVLVTAEQDPDTTRPSEDTRLQANIE